MIIEEIALRMPPLAVLERLSRQPGLAYLEGLRDPRGRSHTVLGYAPRATFEIQSGGASVAGVPARGDALTALDTFLASLPGSDPVVPFPFRCAAIGYLSYELRTLVARVPARARAANPRRDPRPAGDRLRLMPRPSTLLGRDSRRSYSARVDVSVRPGGAGAA